MATGRTVASDDDGRDQSRGLTQSQFVPVAVRARRSPCPSQVSDRE